MVLKGNVEILKRVRIFPFKRLLISGKHVELWKRLEGYLREILWTRGFSTWTLQKTQL